MNILPDLKPFKPQAFAMLLQEQNIFNFDSKDKIF